MLYRANRLIGGGNMAVGYATSPDGVRWTRFAGSPVLSTREIKRTNFYFTSLAYHQGTYYFFFWEVDDRRQTHIHLARRRGPLE